ncbi:3-deoxy-manno-octulosonate cytidylyltransferase [Shewanella sp. AS16]|nr:3-deoxy-manno-octulosonate cytidylyltransferase [Shewanella sp. AS16]
MSLSYAVVIPARYKSSRFPGKPLVDILGKPMIQHVWERCISAVGTDLVYVATDDVRIRDVVRAFGGHVIMTSSECLTGTDRVAEANEVLQKDFIINVQGDEPLIKPQDIITVVTEYQKNPEIIVNAFCKISDEENAFSFTLPKVVFSVSKRLLYISRAAIPLTKCGKNNIAYKQVCIYAFSRKHLEFFLNQGSKMPLEDQEDIEILRFLENDIEVKMVEVDNSSLAVDIPSDLDAVRNRLLTR